MKILIILY